MVFADSYFGYCCDAASRLTLKSRRKRSDLFLKKMIQVITDTGERKTFTLENLVRHLRDFSVIYPTNLFRLIIPAHFSIVSRYESAGACS